MTEDAPLTRSRLARLAGRQELRLAAALWRADRPMALGWWGLLSVRGLLPAGFAVATGVLVAAVERGSGLAAPLLAVAVVFILMQVLGPLHTALSANLGDRAAARLYDEMTGACVAVPGIGHLEDPVLAADLQMARDFDRGMTGPPLSISMDFIAGAWCSWWRASPRRACCSALPGGRRRCSPWLKLASRPTGLLRESAVWRDRQHRGSAAGAAGRASTTAYRLATWTRPAAKELRIFGLPDWVLDRFLDSRRRLHRLQYEATRMRERSLLISLVVVLAAQRGSSSGCSARPRSTDGWRSAASSPTGHGGRGHVDDRVSAG